MTHQTEQYQSQTRRPAGRRRKSCFSISIRNLALACAVVGFSAGAALAIEPPDAPPTVVPATHVKALQPPVEPVPPPPKDTPQPPAKRDVTSEFGPGKYRLPYLPGKGVGATPVMTKEDKELFDRFFGERIVPKMTIDLVVGQPAIYPLKETPKKIQIVDEEVATYNLFEARELSILGRTPGTTVLNIWFADPNDATKEKILSFLLRVVPDPEQARRLEAMYKALEEEINRAFPDSWVCLSLVGDKLMIHGQAKDIVEATQILRIVRSNAPGETAALPIPGVTFDLTALPSLDNVLPRTLHDYILSGGPNVINMLRIPGEQQVMLRVTVAEIDRAAARSIGLNWSLTNNQGITYFANNTGSIATGGLTGAGAQQGAGGFNNLPFSLDNGQISVALSALTTKNLARTLAEPALVAIQGQTASFHSGGQFPVPVIASSGGLGGQLQGVSFVPFGIQLNFTPTITDKDRIRLQVAAEVSVLDLQSGTNIGGGGGGGGGGAGGGTNVSGLSTRNFQTTVELREGQTLAVAGLIQNTYKFDSSRVPFFGDLPLIGRLFAFDRSAYGEQELVILVTPELVHPLEPNEVPPLPGSDVFEPGDLEFFLLARMESLRSYDYRSTVMTDLDRMKRYRHCDQLFIIGPKGHSDGH